MLPTTLLAGLLLEQGKNLRQEGIIVHYRSSTCASAASACGQPERHLHGAIHLDGSGQLSAGLLPLAGLGIQRAQAEVAVGQERAHAEFLGQGEGLPVVMCGRLDLRGGLMGGDLPEEP